MVLYKKTFPLGKGISFSRYIKELEKKHFPNYYLLIEKTPSSINYHATMVSTLPMWRRGWRNGFMDGLLLKECVIQHSEDERYFTIQASAKTANLVFALFMVLCAILLFVFGLFVMVTQDSMSLNNMFGFTIIVIIFLVPPLWIYFQDKNFLDKVGSLGTEFERN